MEFLGMTAAVQAYEGRAARRVPDRTATTQTPMLPPMGESSDAPASASAPTPAATPAVPEEASGAATPKQAAATPGAARQAQAAAAMPCSAHQDPVPAATPSPARKDPAAAATLIHAAGVTLTQAAAMLGPARQAQTAAATPSPSRQEPAPVAMPAKAPATTETPIKAAAMPGAVCQDQAAAMPGAARQDQAAAMPGAARQDQAAAMPGAARQDKSVSPFTPACKARADTAPQSQEVPARKSLVGEDPAYWQLKADLEAKFPQEMVDRYMLPPHTPKRIPTTPAATTPKSPPPGPAEEHPPPALPQPECSEELRGRGGQEAEKLTLEPYPEPEMLPYSRWDEEDPIPSAEEDLPKSLTWEFVSCTLQNPARKTRRRSRTQFAPAPQSPEQKDDITARDLEEKRFLRRAKAQVRGPLCRGVVEDFNLRSGYGFIVAPGIKEGIFVNRRDVRAHLPRGHPGRNLKMGDSVQFTMHQGERGWYALDVAPCTSKPYGHPMLQDKETDTGKETDEDRERKDKEPTDETTTDDDRERESSRCRSPTGPSPGEEESM
ncbi:uncharacterized protein ACNLHF_011677 [Anomaloglossus baeobatrachus]|uniref:uncharacterized protein LOC142295289 n=1 Tax=Anomaloglossus baeobatrachus TaxID=238106 RepID=UPI003F4FAECC